MTVPFSPERWGRAQEVFEEALGLPPDRRAAHVVRRLADDGALAAEVHRLLAGHETTGPLDRMAAGMDSPMGADPLLSDTGTDTGAPPVRLGVWRIDSFIGHGGMGSVYLAERADGLYLQRAAVKLLRRDVVDPGLRRRFLAERRILARIDHPGIARILDGGVTDEGRPWFALEYVEGLPIDRWCDEHGLGVRERLGLFREVCAAVQHAHARLIVHRDIKPANILVTADGRPRLLDFGIARLLDPDLLAEDADPARTGGVLLLTPDYASPEQLRGDAVGVGSDVYQLGVLLFRLLAGRVPRRSHGTGGPETDRDERPSAVAPEALRREIDRDLDTIVAVATRVDPERRYPSVDRLSDDVKRWRDHLPIRARPDTFSYRARRFVRRNRAGVGLAAALGLLLVAFAAVTAVQAGRLERERDRAREVIAFLTGLFQFPDPWDRGDEPVTALEIVDRGAERIRTGITDPLLRAELLSVLATTYQGLGASEQALGYQRESLEFLRTQPRSGLRVAESHRRIAALHAEAGRVDSTLHHGTEAIRLLRRQAPGSLELALALGDHGYYLRVSGDPAAAGLLFEEAIELFDRFPDADRERVARALTNYGFILRSRGETERGDALVQRALALITVEGTESWGQDPEEAERAWAEAVAERRRTHGADHPLTALREVSHARALRALQRDAEAEEILWRAIGVMDTAWPDGDTRIGFALTDLGRLLVDRDRHDEAVAVLRRARAMLPEPRGEGEAASLAATLLLGESLVARSLFAEAEPLLLEVHEVLLGRGPDDARVREHRERLARFYEGWGRDGEAARFRALLQARAGI